MFYFLLENATQGVPISFLLPGTSKIEHELQIEIELSNPRLKNGPLPAKAGPFSPRCVIHFRGSRSRDRRRICRSTWHCGKTGGEGEGSGEAAAVAQWKLPAIAKGENDFHETHARTADHFLGSGLKPSLILIRQTTECKSGQIVPHFRS